MSGYVWKGAVDPEQILTGRQQQILALVANDHTDQQVATALHLSVQTVQVHMKQIRQRLGVGSRAAAVARAIRAGEIR